MLVARFYITFGLDEQWKHGRSQTPRIPLSVRGRPLCKLYGGLDWAGLVRSWISCTSAGVRPIYSRFWEETDRLSDGAESITSGHCLKIEKKNKIDVRMENEEMKILKKINYQ